MKRNKFKVRVIYQRKKYYFDFGSQVYIFHIGICNSFLFEYGIDELLKYTEFVHSCYIKDSNRTPLGELADYIAERWDEVKAMGAYDVLDKFYQSTESGGN